MFIFNRFVFECCLHRCSTKTIRGVLNGIWFWYYNNKQKKIKQWTVKLVMWIWRLHATVVGCFIVWFSFVIFLLFRIFSDCKFVKSILQQCHQQHLQQEHRRRWWRVYLWKNSVGRIPILLHGIWQIWIWTKHSVTRCLMKILMWVKTKCVSILLSIVCEYECDVFFLILGTLSTRSHNRGEDRTVPNDTMSRWTISFECM